MPQIWLSIGSNVDREKHIRGAIKDLRERYAPLIISTVYETQAVGFSGAPFLNLVVGFESAIAPRDLVTEFREIEHLHHRDRQAKKFSDRTLDIDLLTWGDEVLASESLVLPRDEIEKYSFVLGPLAEVAPEQLHPQSGKSFAQMWAEFDSAGQTLTAVDFCWDN